MRAQALSGCLAKRMGWQEGRSPANRAHRCADRRFVLLFCKPLLLGTPSENLLQSSRTVLDRDHEEALNRQQLPKQWLQKPGRWMLFCAQHEQPARGEGYGVSLATPWKVREIKHKLAKEKDKENIAHLSKKVEQLKWRLWGVAAVV